VVLDLEWIPVEKIDPKDWENMDRDLCRLAKRFKVASGGRMMRVSIVGYHDQGFRRLENEWPMPALKEEANVVIPDNECGPFAHMTRLPA
jgi:hypothetical protein